MNEKRFFVCSDLHGQYDLWKQIKEYINENDTLIFLGDAIDRGPWGIKIMQEMLADPRVIYLLGNHEDMMLDWYLSRGEKEEYGCLKHWFQNGGNSTYSAFMELDFTQRDDLIKKLLKLKYEEEITAYAGADSLKIYLNHAGSSPHNTLHNRHTCLWRRDHFKWEWPKDCPDVVIHGHTPKIYMEKQYGVKFEKDMVTYCNGHKVCLDWGCFATGAIPLYNLNESKLEKVFYKEEKENN